MTVKELFDKAENGTLTWEQFQHAMGDSKFVDLTEGQYVSKQKHEDELSQRDNRITELTTSLATRDTDLENLRTTLKDAGDIESLKQAAADLSKLQAKYDKETKEYQKQISKQAYEFAVKDFANGKSFSSNAAKRDFIQAMTAKGLSLENGKIIGAEDFVEIYSKDNADAFAKVEPAPTSNNKPQFAGSTQPAGNNKPTLTEMMKMKNDNPNIKFY